MKATGLSGLLVLLATASAAQANWTARASFLFATPEDLDVRSASDSFGAALDNGFGWSLALGYDLPLLRVEGEAILIQNDIGDPFDDDFSLDGDVDRFMGFANAFFDFPVIPFIDGYVGGGVGFAQARIDADGEGTAYDLTDSQSGFGYQLMAGLRAKVLEDVSLSAGYRYMVLENIDFGEGASSISLDGGDHVWELSVGFVF